MIDYTTFCPSFDELPDDKDEFSLLRYGSVRMSSGDQKDVFAPMRHWCYLSEIVIPNYHPTLPSSVVKDLNGRTHPIIFDVENGSSPPSSSQLHFPVGHTMALLYPFKQTFLDNTQGIRMGDTNVKVFRCPLPVLLDESMKIGKDLCYSCGTSTGHLLKCGKCAIGLYCNKECQTSHWKCHKSLCGDMKVLDKLVRLVHTRFQDYVTFQILDSSVGVKPSLKTGLSRGAIQVVNTSHKPPTTAPKPSPPNSLQPEKGGLILLYDINEELFFECFGKKASWPCDFQSVGKDCSKAQLKTILHNPQLTSVIIQEHGGRHWNKVISYYKNGGFIVYFGIIGEYAAPKKLSEIFDLEWTYSAYTRHEYELTQVGKQILGDAITEQEYSKSNLIKAPVADRILVPKHHYASVKALIQDEFNGEDGDIDELMEKGKARYDTIREELNGQVPLALHKANHGGRIAYLGFVNGAGNIPKLVQAVCMGVSTSSLSTV